MGKILTVTRRRVVILLEQGKSQAEISRQTGVSRCGIQALVKKHQETGQVEDKPRSGRPRKLKKSDEKYLKVTSLIEREKNKYMALAAHLAQTSGHKYTYLRNGLRTERSS